MKQHQVAGKSSGSEAYRAKLDDLRDVHQLVTARFAEILDLGLQSHPDMRISMGHGYAAVAMPTQVQAYEWARDHQKVPFVGVRLRIGHMGEDTDTPVLAVIDQTPLVIGLGKRTQQSPARTPPRIGLSDVAGYFTDPEKKEREHRLYYSEKRVDGLNAALADVMDTLDNHPFTTARSLDGISHTPTPEEFGSIAITSLRSAIAIL